MGNMPSSAALIHPPQAPRYRSGDYGPCWTGRNISVPFAYADVDMQNAVHPGQSSTDQGGYGESLRRCGS